jgi:alpha-tubulin suppressor-like RCC1 family protein
MLPAFVDNFSAGWAHSCAVLSTGFAYCWGLNSAGQLGVTAAYQSMPSPYRITVGFSDAFVSIAAGGNHTCAMFSSHTVRCWGSGVTGQLGYGSNTDSFTVPSAPLALGGLSARVTAGTSFSCALVIAGAALTVRCWGDNTHGQLGIDSFLSTSVPLSAVSQDDIISLSASYEHACVVSYPGNVTCWGRGAEGMLCVTCFALSSLLLEAARTTHSGCLCGF